MGVTWWVATHLNFDSKEEEAIRYFRIDVKFPDKYTMAQRLDYFQKVEQMAEEKKADCGLKAYEVHYGKWYGRFAGFFAPDRVSSLTPQEAIQELFDAFPEEPGVRVSYKDQKSGGGAKGNQKYMHYIRLVGDDPEQLKKVHRLKPLSNSYQGSILFSVKISRRKARGGGAAGGSGKSQFLWYPS